MSVAAHESGPRCGPFTQAAGDVWFKCGLVSRHITVTTGLQAELRQERCKDLRDVNCFKALFKCCLSGVYT